LLFFLSELGVLAVKDVLKDKEPHGEDGKSGKKALMLSLLEF
jgi:hypothetical protein